MGVECLPISLQSCPNHQIDGSPCGIFVVKGRNFDEPYDGDEAIASRRTLVSLFLLSARNHEKKGDTHKPPNTNDEMRSIFLKGDIVNLIA